MTTQLENGKIRHFSFELCVCQCFVAAMQRDTDALLHKNAQESDCKYVHDAVIHASYYE